MIKKFSPLIAVFLLMILGACSRRSFTVPTLSMAPTIPPGSTISADMSAYSKRAPERWDVVIFNSPPSEGPGGIWTMRVIGLPGEQVSFDGSGHVLINGNIVAAPASLAGIYYQRRASETGGPVPIPHPYTVPADCFYVLGDNPPNSNDSRFWRAVPRKDILGKVSGK